ncbi:MAG: hypothetical protein J6U70_03975 [Bacteroidales bacterium]|nr:hypothetical protein [Bacteroidales bacterium]
MQNKLQELTDKLYNEGLSKGKQEAEDLKAKARKEAAAIVEKAREEAEALLAQARKDAEELRKKAETDIRMASAQTVASIKQGVETMITTRTIAEPAKAALAAPEFIQELVKTIVAAFRADSEALDLTVILPANLQKELEEFAKAQTAAAMQGGLEVRFSKQIGNGFKIGPKNGGYLISFTGDDFEQLFADYLRPATRKLLFG